MTYPPLLQVCSGLMLSQIGSEKYGSTLVDLVLYSESEGDVKPVNSSNNNSNQSLILTRMKRKNRSNVANSPEDSPQILLRTLQERFSSSERFQKVLVLRGFVFPLFSFSLTLKNSFCQYNILESNDVFTLVKHYYFFL
ncbi:unnamed protein product [Gongylonema pulchrum]|uniref:Uncharacterized protein n=1 Tax=Gongylonema pulchrum TaxID=637853 RepID=A0A183EDP6_9BILA|nr:unnamed protein product [Gongylonema pulchrum]